MQCAVSRRILGNDLAPLPSGSFHGEFPDVGRPHEQADRSGGSRPVRIDQRPFRPHGKRCRGHAQPNEAAWQAQRREQRRGSISKSPAEGAFKQAAASHDRRQVARFRHGKRNLAAKFNLIGSEPIDAGGVFPIGERPSRRSRPAIGVRGGQAHPPAPNPQAWPPSPHSPSRFVWRRCR